MLSFLFKLLGCQYRSHYTVVYSQEFHCVYYKFHFIFWSVRLKKKIQTVLMCSLRYPWTFQEFYHLRKMSLISWSACAHYNILVLWYPLEVHEFHSFHFKHHSNVRITHHTTEISVWSRETSLWLGVRQQSETLVSTNRRKSHRI